MAGGLLLALAAHALNNAGGMYFQGKRQEQMQAQRSAQAAQIADAMFGSNVEQGQQQQQRTTHSQGKPTDTVSEQQDIRHVYQPEGLNVPIVRMDARANHYPTFDRDKFAKLYAVNPKLAMAQMKREQEMQDYFIKQDYASRQENVRSQRQFFRDMYRQDRASDATRATNEAKAAQEREAESEKAAKAKEVNDAKIMREQDKERATLRTNWRNSPSVKSFREAEVASNNLIESVSKDSPLYNIAAIYQFFGVIEPGGRVTDAEGNMVIRSGSMLEQLQALIGKNAEGKGFLSEKQRADIAELARKAIDARYTALESETQTINQQAAKEIGVYGQMDNGVYIDINTLGFQRADDGW